MFELTNLEISMQFFLCYMPYIFLFKCRVKCPGGDYSTMFCTGRFPVSEVQALSLLCTIFDRKFTPFTYLTLELCIRYNCRKCIASQFNMNKSLNQGVSCSFTSLKCTCQPFFDHLRTEMTNFPTLLYTSTHEISTLS